MTSAQQRLIVLTLYWTWIGGCSENSSQSEPINAHDSDTLTQDVADTGGERASLCANGVVEDGEECDDGNDFSDDACVRCVHARCGDGFIHHNVEACDDANASSGDGCSEDCQIEQGFYCVRQPSVCSADPDPCFLALGVLCADFEQAYIKPSNSRYFEQFGTSVALSGDTLAVGAQGEASDATGINGDQANRSAWQSGAVYVFTRSGTTWTQQAYIKASNTGPGHQFGISVALDGDTLAVGAVGEVSDATGINGDQADHAAIQSGAVYVFTRSGTTWTQQAYIKASNTNGKDLFGTSVTLSGDTLAVGAVGEDSDATGINGDQANSSAEDSGAVYVFTRAGTTWTQQAYIKASNTGPSHQFGTSVALEGDTLAVGAQGEDSDATGINGDPFNHSAWRSGAVYVFTRAGTTWTQQAYIKSSNPDDVDGFGNAIALSGDTLAVSAVGEQSNATGINGDQADNSAWRSGAVYVFTRSGMTWTQQAYIKASNTEANDQFGYSIALDGDTLAVGAQCEASKATGLNGDQFNRFEGLSCIGAVYIFTRAGTTWTQLAYVKASHTDTSDFFGYSVALLGDTLAVGAYGESSVATGINGDQADRSGYSIGAVYVRQIAP
jgi:trimeric autotransporter adhesin